MRLFTRTLTPLGPRTQVQGGLLYQEAKLLADHINRSQGIMRHAVIAPDNDRGSVKDILARRHAGIS